MLHRSALFFTQAELDKVRNSTFAISGLGGVGAITAELLARWGIKRFRLLDMDRYEPSNLNRQLFATSETLGQYKVDVAERRIKEINPYAEVELKIVDGVDNDNVHQFIEGAGIAIQNADQPSCKLFYLAARKYRVPLVNGYATLTGGRVQTFDYRNSPCETYLERLWNRLKFRNSKPLEQMSRDEIIAFDKRYVHDTSPSLNFVTNMVGCLIVAEAVKLLTGKGNVLHYPNYLEFDTFHFKMRIRNADSPFNTENIKKFMSVLIKKGD